jgi:hypothetical protein
LLENAAGWISRKFLKSLREMLLPGIFLAVWKYKAKALAISGRANKYISAIVFLQCCNNAMAASYSDFQTPLCTP